MAGTYLSPNLSCRGPVSPKGFWPNPEEDTFLVDASTPWEVPKRRKLRGHKKYFFDSTTENIKSFSNGEVTTANRYKVLEDYYTEEDTLSYLDPPSRMKKEKKTSRMKKEKKTSTPSEGALYKGYTLYNDYSDFFMIYVIMILRKNIL